MKHTPGPWSLTPNNWRIYRVTQIGTVTIAEVKDDIFNLPNDEEAIANARLIAAAPDLLDVCKELFATMVEYEMAVEVDAPPAHRAMMERARAAIAKARGD